MKDKRINKKTLCKAFEIFISVISIVLSLILYDNYAVLFARAGCEKMQIKVSDEARKNCDYSVALEFYERIMNQNDEYSPYAALARLQIYNDSFAETKHEDEMLECLKVAAKSDDINVLYSCLEFVIQKSDEIIDESIFFDEENIVIIQDIFNKINKIDKNFLNRAGIETDISVEATEWILLKDRKVDWETYHWEYVSTSVTTEAGLEFISDDEKLVAVDSFQERADNSSAALITYYKYYRYERVVDSTEKKLVKDILRENIPKSKTIYLSQISF